MDTAINNARIKAELLMFEVDDIKGDDNPTIAELGKSIDSALWSILHALELCAKIAASEPK